MISESRPRDGEWRRCCDGEQGVVVPVGVGIEIAVGIGLV